MRIAEFKTGVERTVRCYRDPAPGVGSDVRVHRNPHPLGFNPKSQIRNPQSV